MSNAASGLSSNIAVKDADMEDLSWEQFFEKVEQELPTEDDEFDATESSGGGDCDEEAFSGVATLPHKSKPL
jgi:hypothetical protein